jgi:hypothetical protein
MAFDRNDLTRGDLVDNAAAEDIATCVDLVANGAGHLFEEGAHPAVRVGRHATVGARVLDPGQMQGHACLRLIMDGKLRLERMLGEDVAIQHQDWVVRAAVQPAEDIADTAAGVERHLLCHIVDRQAE